MILRLLAVAVGLAVLAATAHVTILSSGGYGAPHAVLTLAIAAGVGIGAIVIGASWTDRRRSLAVAIAVALLSGELFGLAMTAERLITQRDQAQEPARKAAADRRQIAADMRQLEGRLAAVTTTPRLEAAIAAQRKVAETVAAKAAEKACAANCRALLEEQVTAAKAEVVAARMALAGERTAIEVAIAAQRTRLEAITATASGTPLADRLGLPPWMLDLIVAALGALGANGLAATLIAFGAHHPRTRESAPALVAADSPVEIASPAPLELTHAAAPEPMLPPEPQPEIIEATPQPARPVTDVTQHAARFGLERLQPAPGARADLVAIHVAYRAWCAEIGSQELPPASIAEALAKLFADVGIAIEHVDGKPVAVGIRIKGRRSGAKSTAIAMTRRSAA